MDRIIEREEGFYVIVDGREFGFWIDRRIAKAGLKVEQRRAAARQKKEKP